MTGVHRCPVAQCGRENPADATVCSGCRSPLREYRRLLDQPARLFNRGLAAAEAGRTHEARELFAAVVHWLPRDVEARNALAYTSLETGDETEAARHWREILERWPDDAHARRGLELIVLNEQRRRAAGAGRKKDKKK